MMIKTKWTMNIINNNAFECFIFRASLASTMLLNQFSIWKKVIGIYWWASKHLIQFNRILSVCGMRIMVANNAIWGARYSNANTQYTKTLRLKDTKTHACVCRIPFWSVLIYQNLFCFVFLLLAFSHKQSAVNRVLPQDHIEPDVPYNPESLNNLNIAGTSSNENRMPASPNALLHRNIFGSGEYRFIFVVWNSFHRILTFCHIHLQWTSLYLFVFLSTFKRTANSDKCQLRWQQFTEHEWRRHGRRRESR